MALDRSPPPGSPLPSLDVEIPPALQASVQRHQTNLVRLVQQLRGAGMDEGQIEASVTILIDSYRRELLDAIRALPQTAPGAKGHP